MTGVQLRRNLSSMLDSLMSSMQCVKPLSKGKQTFLFCSLMSQPRTKILSIKMAQVIHDQLFATYQTGSLPFPLKQRGFALLPITEAAYLARPYLRTAAVSRFLLCLPPWQCFPLKSMVFASSVSEKSLSRLRLCRMARKCSYCLRHCPLPMLTHHRCPTKLTHGTKPC